MKQATSASERRRLRPNSTSVEYSGVSNGTGQANSFFGNNAGFFNDGSFNSCFGGGSGRSNFTWESNCFFGVSARGSTPLAMRALELLDRRPPSPQRI